jgi:hypothetical protein
MRKFVDRWARLVSLLAVLSLLATAPANCGDDDDDDAVDDDNDDGTPDDDDDDNDNDNDDNDTANEVDVAPPSQAIPAGTTFQFAAAVTIDDTLITDGFAWNIEDTAFATVDQTGLVTGVANGVTNVWATYEDATGSALVVIGPDVFAFDNLNGKLTAVDRGNETAVADYLAKKDAIGAVLNDIERFDTYAALVDSGDLGPGVTGNEKLLVVNLVTKTVETTVPLNMDSPWSVAVEDYLAYVTGNLDDQLAEIDLAAETPTPVYHALDEGCVPADVVVVDGLVYVTCTGFDATGFTYDPGKVLVFDPAVPGVIDTIDLPQVNPQRFAVSAGGKLYVVCTGDYAANFGMVVQIDPSTNDVADSFALGTAPGPIGIGPSGLAFVGEGFAGSVYVFDTADNSVLRDAADPIAIPDAFWIQGLGVHPETGDAYVCDQGNSEVWVIAGADPFGTVFHVDLPNPGGVAFW